LKRRRTYCIDIHVWFLLVDPGGHRHTESEVKDDDPNAVPPVIAESRHAVNVQSLVVEHDQEVQGQHDQRVVTEQLDADVFLQIEKTLFIMLCLLVLCIHMRTYINYFISKDIGKENHIAFDFMIHINQCVHENALYKKKGKTKQQKGPTLN
jgi:hypothetical protein